MDGEPPSLGRRRFLAGGLGALSLLGLTGVDGQGEMTTADGDTGGARSDDPPDPSSTGDGVLVNQVGYRRADRKLAVVRTDAAGFVVVDTAADSVVDTGSFDGRIEDDSSGDTVRLAEFTAVSTPGTYRVVTADGTAGSVEFTVGADVWRPTLHDLCRQYTLRRSGTALTDTRTGLDIDAGHPQDEAAALYFSDEFHAEGDTVDVSGGWYDAGDYGKYVPTAAVTVAQLLLAYELSPGTFAADEMQFLDGVAQAARTEGVPDLLTEVRFELEWLERMQRLDGAVYHKVAGTEWPDTVAPAADTQQRYVFGLSTFGTGLYAGAMAMAGRVYEQHDPEFATRLVENARDAFEFLESEAEPVFRHDDGQDSGSGAYRKETDTEERFWAAAELARTTGDASYGEYISRECPERRTAPPTPIAWNDARLLGQWAYQAATAVDLPEQDAVRETLLSRADELATAVETDGYRVALDPDEYVWGSTRRALATGNVLLFADEIEAADRYSDGALAQVHYALGRTPTGSSYVTGVGEQSPDAPHDRLAGSTGVTVPGHVVGGPNRDGGDPVLAEYIESADPAPARAYVDDSDSYASNEPAIDYAAPLVLAIAGTS